ncbi:P-loop containing nucleoside triphosphate hydrolase protein, partial [Aureobasidium melanogenum]
ADIRYKAELIREKRQLIRNEAKMRKSLKNRAVIPRSKKAVQLEKMERGLEALGHDSTSISERARARSQSRPRGRSEAVEDADMMDVDGGDAPAKHRNSISRAMSRTRSVSRMNRREDGVSNEVARTKAERLHKLGQKKMNRSARQGEGDRHTTASLAKWLTAGKRGNGSTRSSSLSFSVLLCTKYSTPVDEDDGIPVRIHTIADDISNVNAADSAQNGASLPDGDTAAPLECSTLSEGLIVELIRFFNLCDAVDDVAQHRDALNAIANAHYAALNNHEAATNVDMYTIYLDVLTSLDDHIEWFRLNNTAPRNVPEIYRLSSNVIAREEELTAIERDIRARFGAELTENAGAEMVVQFEDVTRDLAINRDGLLARCRAILGMATATPASS